MNFGTKKLLASALIALYVAVFVLFPVQSAHALDGGAGWVNVGRELADTIGKTVARMLLMQFLNDMVNKVKTLGRDAGPAFVRDWQAFKAEGQYRGEDKFRAILANTKLCSHLRESSDANFGISPKIKSVLLTGVRTREGSLLPFTLRGRCTLPDGFNLEAHLGNPSGNGGWEAFLRMLEPQNNDLGVGLMAAQELGIQRSAEEQADVNEALSGAGYTSAREPCDPEDLGGGARCVVLEKIKTPADLLAKTAGFSVEKLVDYVVETDEVSDSVVVNAVATVISQTIINRINNFAESEDDTFSQPSTREQRANEYCTLVSPRDDVDAEFRGQFDTTPGEKGPCPSPDKNNLGYVHVCVQRCMQALGLISDQVTVDNTNSPPEFAPSPSPNP